MRRTALVAVVASAAIGFSLLPSAAAAADLGPDTRLAIVRLDASGHPDVETRDVKQAYTGAVATMELSEPGTLAVSIDKVATTAALSNDPFRHNQWALNNLEAEKAWAGGDATGITVAVIDTGVQTAHPDLSGNILPGIDLVAGTGNGWVDPNGHGTHVAGIIAATADNGVGIAGLARGAKILPIRVLGANGSGFHSDIADGIIYAADHGAKIINMSLGGEPSTVLAAAVAYAQDKGVLVVAAAGNNGSTTNDTMYPAAYPGVLAVAASDVTNRIASFSEKQPYVALAAPGVIITSTVPGGYTEMSGTSMASPYAAAAAALAWSAKPSATAAQVANALTSTATDLGTPGKDNASGYGLVNPAAARAALTGATAQPKPTTPPTPAPSTDTPTSGPASILVNAPQSAVSGTSTLLRVTVRNSDGSTSTGARVTVYRLSPSGETAVAAAVVGGTGMAYPRVPIRTTALYRVRVADTQLASPAMRITALMKAAMRTTRSGGHTRVQGSVLPASRGTARIDAYRNGHWTPCATGLINSAGRFALTCRSATTRIVLHTIDGSITSRLTGTGTRTATAAAG